MELNIQTSFSSKQKLLKLQHEHLKTNSDQLCDGAAPTPLLPLLVVSCSLRRWLAPPTAVLEDAGLWTLRREGSVRGCRQRPHIEDRGGL